AKLTLLEAGGSARVEFGNLLSLPYEDGMLYVEPVYVRTTATDAYPLLQKVLMSYGQYVTLADSVEEAWPTWSSRVNAGSRRCRMSRHRRRARRSHHRPLHRLSRRSRRLHPRPRSRHRTSPRPRPRWRRPSRSWRTRTTPVTSRGSPKRCSSGTRLGRRWRPPAADARPGRLGDRAARSTPCPGGGSA